jgi:thioredoxin-related protein
MFRPRTFAFILVLLLSVSALSAQHFVSTYSVAQAKAKNMDKPLLILFSGSDWCKPCMQLHKTVYETEKFQKYADETFVMYFADFPRRPQNQLPEDVKATNQSLASQYALGGVPTTVVLSSDGKKVLGKIVGNPDGTYDGYVKKLKSLVGKSK